MIDLFGPVSRACRIHVPPDQRKGIAIVGAGVIVDVAHLPAYRRGGLRIIGITDLDHDRARAVAERQTRGAEDVGGIGHVRLTSRG